MPAIMRWPGYIAPDSVCTKMASTIDVLPTVAAITGAALPEHPIDGVDILPLLKGDPSAHPRTEFWFFYTGELRAVREGRFKRVFEHRTRSYSGVEPGMDGHPGPYAFPTVPAALYDLDADIGESVDVSGEHPDVVARLDAMGERARAALGDRLTQQTGTEVRPPGRRSLGRPDTIEHLGVGATVMSATDSDPRYAGAGSGALVDGRAGSGDFRDGRWLAFDGVDLAVALDLGEARSVSRVGVDCLQVQSAWILLPRSLSVSVSADGEDWRSLPTLTVTPEPDTTVEARLLSVDVGGGPVRYIRVVAANRAILPDWHVGAGDTGWIFVDEIVVEGA